MKKQVDLNKITVYSMVINAIQIFAIFVLVLVVLFDQVFDTRSIPVRLAFILVAVLVAVGAGVDIRDAVSTRRTLEDVEALEKSIQEVENLNYTLRAQRHDFLNHLQVVYSLMEMKDYDEADAYIEKVYGDISSLSSVIKTANPAVNALLKVKLSECQKKGVKTSLQIQSAWKELPVPGWEMCRVLSNLMDNAVDAMKETKAPMLEIIIGEDIKSYHFTVANNGPDIPEESQKSIFQPGVTSKGQGHGMGLSIVQETMQKYQGEIRLQSGGGRTAFTGVVPRSAVADNKAKTIL